jgi:hypothetical protein
LIKKKRRLKPPPSSALLSRPTLQKQITGFLTLELTGSWGLHHHSRNTQNNGGGSSDRE